jgi:hypothetical protein
MTNGNAGSGGAKRDESVQEQLVPVATETLLHFENTADSATSQIMMERPASPNALAIQQSLTSDKALRNLAGLSEERLRNLAVLATEPAIARIVFADEDDGRQTIFIARATPATGASGGALFASYRAPMGRLGSAQIGEELEIKTPRGSQYFTVVERAALRPMKLDGEWDAQNTVFESESAGPVTVVSLRAVLRSIGISDAALDLLDSLLQEDRENGNIIDGIRRTVIEKMGLRDQPLLDRYQDDIFRLPIDTQLVILGPPGTGKTTTLIKRLGLKLDFEFLDPEERQSISKTRAGVAGHASSWLMFTPTELLKQYVKEAFSREGIAASDLRIQTWADYRRDLARQKLRILRTTSSRGAILREAIQNLKPETLSDPIGWYSDFSSWQTAEFWAELQRNAQIISKIKNGRVSKVSRNIMSIVEGKPSMNSATFIAFDAIAEEIAELAALTKSEIDADLRGDFSYELAKNKNLLGDILVFLKTLGDPIEAVDDIDDPDADEDEEELRVRLGDREEAFEAYKRAVRAQARATVQKRTIGRTTRNGRIVAWLGDRTPTPSRLLEIGEKVQALAALRRFANPLRAFISRIPSRYRRYRRDRQGSGAWYTVEAQSPLDLGPLEVDLIILAMLESARSLISDRRTARLLDEPRYSTLRSIQDLYRSQIVVDEATDFSPLQLGCMAQLTDPATESFVACGDFNQRITSWGTRSEAELKWIYPNFDIRSIIVTYRQSAQLAAFAEKLMTLTGGSGVASKLPDHLSNDGVNPILAMSLQGPQLVQWLADRILEIERITETLPSIAILVNDEALVQPLASALHEVLASQNIRCSACPGGQVRGQDNDVRVFDVQHIKGLEFEAVFFASADVLERLKPDLFDKYLYVGATRAATFLGITCEGSALPSKLAELRNDFDKDWA